MAQDVKRRFWRGLLISEIVAIEGTEATAAVRLRGGASWYMPGCSYSQAVKEIEETLRMNDRCDEQAQCRAYWNSVERAVKAIKDIETSQLHSAAISLRRAASKIEKLIKESKNV